LSLVALSESTADEAAIRILVEAIKGAPVTWFAPTKWRNRGWPAVLRELPVVIQHLHYQTDATGLVVVVDTNSSPPHEVVHRTRANPECRLCALQAKVEQTIANLTPRLNRPVLRVAFGVATPAIEAWYLAGKRPHPSEQAWIAEGPKSYSKMELKREAYGTDRPNLPLQTRRAEEEARRLAEDLGLLRANFPRGFGCFETGVAALA
jgi:hypothetical protein